MSEPFKISSREQGMAYVFDRESRDCCGFVLEANGGQWDAMRDGERVGRRGSRRGAARALWELWRAGRPMGTGGMGA